MEVDEVAKGSGEGLGNDGGAGSSALVNSGENKKTKRFEIKRYNAVALWAWGK